MLTSSVIQPSLEGIIETDHEETTHHEDSINNINEVNLQENTGETVESVTDVKDNDEDLDDVVFHAMRHITASDDGIQLEPVSSSVKSSLDSLQTSFLNKLVENDDNDNNASVENVQTSKEDFEYEEMHDSANNSRRNSRAAPRLSAYFNNSDRSTLSSSSVSRRGSSRQSFASSSAARRISTETAHTNVTAPPILVNSSTTQLEYNDIEGGRNTQRRVTIHGRADGDNSNEALSSSLASRSSRFRMSRDTVVDPNGLQYQRNSAKKASGFVGSIINRRRSTRFNNTSTSTAAGRNTSVDSNTTSMVDAVERLNMYKTSDFEYVSAAAAVVSATMQNPGKRAVAQFGQGEHVLVIMAILGLADAFGDKESYTIDPVNKVGYPRGEGKTEAQNQSPFLYVLCVVKQVHFDEDERYYTIQRCDTGKEQRADPGYMEPIRDPEAIEVAYNASQRTRKSMPDQNRPAPKVEHFCVQWMKAMIVFGLNMKRLFIPAYVRTKHSSKNIVQRFLHGEPGCALRLQFSGINFLVCCSLFFLFHDVFALGYLPPSADSAINFLGFSVWIILVGELFLEFMIRPSNYEELVQSDKAFAPSTARLLNRFHFVCESLSLLLYLPQTSCALSSNCDATFGATRRTLWALTSRNVGKAIVGRFFIGFIFLRSFGLARHWKKMWLNHTYDKNKQERSLVRQVLFVEKVKTSRNFFRRKKYDDDAGLHNLSESLPLNDSKPVVSDGDQQLENAATIGTSLMVVNSHRALFIIIAILCILPSLYAALTRNPVSINQLYLLQDNNVASNTTDDCEYLFHAVNAWLSSAATIQAHYDINDNSKNNARLQWAQLLPVRCDWQNSDGIITTCAAGASDTIEPICTYWDETKTTNPSMDHFADALECRPSGIVDLSTRTIAPAAFSNDYMLTEFYVRAIFNESHSIGVANATLFLLMASMLLFAFFGLTIMRSDSERLVLSPLQHMLSIIVRYAENPLSTPSPKDSRTRSGKSQSDDDSEDELGHYETEQLINAISKIADLLRKCWGIAGAGIISANLARTKDGRTVVFNPTIPGKQVYALFVFIGINDFSKQLRSLEQDVMILINDVARVVHDEVYRWALGDSGQCNKNLGSAFLMVFRIGDFMEVHDKKRKATDVVFDSQLKVEKTRQRQGSNFSKRPSSNAPFDVGRDGSLQLASLPGIQTFSDRALLGCLKSFAGLHRDQRMQDWQKDFRLGAGVGNFHISVIYGMDAGWAVEGAVGSEYKIDATYLSPHVNMASRMMSACKQYGVKVLLSQAVEELLSKTARSKLRHLDTVYVKGSNVSQRIYAYDARHEGVDFFLFERTPDQADIEAEAYNASIWDNDQDLKSMRQHVTDDFMKTFHRGVELYLEGHWKAACKSLEEADNIMFENVLESGFVDYITEDLGEYGKNLKISKEELSRLKSDFGDGACKCLIQYMQRRKFTPPPDWQGVRHLMSK